MTFLRSGGVAATAAALFMAPASAAQESAQPSPEQMKAMLEGMLDAAAAEILRPGERQPDWSSSGVDLRAAIAARPGGTARNYLVSLDKDGEASVSILTSAPAAAFIPKDWKRLSRNGDIDAAAPEPSLEFGQLDGRYYFVARVGSKAVGKATCSSAAVGAELYEAPGTNKPNALPPEMLEIMFKALIGIMSKQTVCEAAATEGSGYKIRYFLEDGRSLPTLNSMNSRTIIVAAAPVSELLKPKAN